MIILRGDPPNPGLPLDGLSISARCQHLLLTSSGMSSSTRTAGRVLSDEEHNPCGSLQSLDMLKAPASGPSSLGWVLVGRRNEWGEVSNSVASELVCWNQGICTTEAWDLLSRDLTWPKMLDAP